MWKKCYWSSLARKFNVDSLYIRKLIKLPHNRWCLLLLTSTWKLWTLSIWAWKLCTNNIYRGDNFHGTRNKTLMFLYLNYENDKWLNLCCQQIYLQSFKWSTCRPIRKPLYHFSSYCTMLHCLPKKVIFLSLFSKGIYHQISNCIKSMWMWLVKNLQNFCNFQFLAAVASNWYPVTKTSLIDTYINHKPISFY